MGATTGPPWPATPVVIFLNNDTVLSGRWLDPLIVPFDEDATVGATGPRSNFVSGPQVAEGAAYLPGDLPAMRRFARTWAQDHRGQTTEDRTPGRVLPGRAPSRVRGGRRVRHGLRHRWVRGRRPVPADRGLRSAPPHRPRVLRPPRGPSDLRRQRARLVRRTGERTGTDSSRASVWANRRTTW